MVNSQKHRSLHNREIFNSRKGVSSVVSNIFLTLLVVLGIAVLAVVVNSISSKADTVEGNCFTIQVEPKTCTLAPNSRAKIVLERGPGAGYFYEVLGIISDETNSGVFSLPGSSGSKRLTELSTLLKVAIIPDNVVGPNMKVSTVVRLQRNGQLCPIVSAPINCN